MMIIEAYLRDVSPPHGDGSNASSFGIRAIAKMPLDATRHGGDESLLCVSRHADG